MSQERSVEGIFLDSVTIFLNNGKKLLFFSSTNLLLVGFLIAPVSLSQNKAFNTFFSINITFEFAKIITFHKINL